MTNSKKCQMLRSDPIIILGSTGSVGQSAVDVVLKNKKRFSVALLAAKRNSSLLLKQAASLRCPRVYLDDEKARAKLGLKTLPDREGLLEYLAVGDFNTVVFALTDFELSARALDIVFKRKDRSLKVAVATKEPLVVFGGYFRDLALKNGHTILPLDSEPSALFQCLGSLNADGNVKKIYLTATGGPFYRRSMDPGKITPEIALKHPVWKMGSKITIDSATLVNKAFELMEISNLFGLSPSQIQILVHPQCVVHSMVEFKNGSILAQMGPSDMRLPIHFALHWPKGFNANGAVQPMGIEKLETLTFEKPDFGQFPCLKIALGVASSSIENSKKAMLMRAALVGADEMAVQMFLDREVSFKDLPRLLEGVMKEFLKRQTKRQSVGMLQESFDIYHWAKASVREAIK